MGDYHWDGRKSQPRVPARPQGHSELRPLTSPQCAASMMVSVKMEARVRVIMGGTPGTRGGYRVSAVTEARVRVSVTPGTRGGYRVSAKPGVLIRARHWVARS